MTRYLVSTGYSVGMDLPLGKLLGELPGPLLLTGHTGFKGTWMTFLLESLNVPVVGYSLPAEKDSLFERAGRVGAIPEVFSDIRDYETLDRFIDSHKPSTIVHMAAQPLVLKSYKNPRETFDVNVMGTVNVLDSAFKKDFVKAIVVVTTDKVYRNDNSGRSFTESDSLEGKDPYSASKVATESAVSAWQQIKKVSGGPKVVSVRAGNVIGGGDFGDDRLLPDLIRGNISGYAIDIRNPNSRRPWQHILDPLTGYLLALESALAGRSLASYNFGPSDESLSVSKVLECISEVWPNFVETVSKPTKIGAQMESEVISLDSKSAATHLKWKACYSQTEAVHKTILWWKDFLLNGGEAQNLCKSEILSFLLSIPIVISNLFLWFAR